MSDKIKGNVVDIQSLINQSVEEDLPLGSGGGGGGGSESIASTIANAEGIIIGSAGSSNFRDASFLVASQQWVFNGTYYFSITNDTQNDERGSAFIIRTTDFINIEFMFFGYISSNDSMKLYANTSSKEVFVLYSNNIYISSDNGCTWGYTNNSFPSSAPEKVFYDTTNSRFVGLVIGDDNFYYSDDGIVWSTGEQVGSGYISNLEFVNNLWIAVCDDGIYTSTDGIAFTQKHAQAYSYFYGSAFDGYQTTKGIIYSNGYYIVVCDEEDGYTPTLLVSSTGTTWELVPGLTGLNPSILDVQCLPSLNKIVILGDFGFYYIDKSDPSVSNWTATQCVMTSTGYDVPDSYLINKVGNTLFVAAEDSGGSNFAVLKSSTGTSFSTIITTSDNRFFLDYSYTNSLFFKSYNDTSYLQYRGTNPSFYFNYSTDEGSTINNANISRGVTSIDHLIKPEKMILGLERHNKKMIILPGSFDFVLDSLTNIYTLDLFKFIVKNRKLLVKIKASFFLMNTTSTTKKYMSTIESYVFCESQTNTELGTASKTVHFSDFSTADSAIQVNSSDIRFQLKADGTTDNIGSANIEVDIFER